MFYVSIVLMRDKITNTSDKDEVYAFTLYRSTENATSSNFI